MDEKKIIIGTANFGMKYGFNNSKISINEIKEISKILIKNKINKYDTAQCYGNSEKKIGMLRLKKKVFTKIIIEKKNNQKLDKTIDILIRKSLKSLNSKKIEGVFIHNIKYFINNKNIQHEIINVLKKYKRKKIINKIGFSFYTLNELNQVLNIFKPDMVQVPINIFDQRFLDKKIIKKLIKSKIEIHARSIFLRGNLIENNEFESVSVKKKIQQFEKWCELKKVDKISACINYVRQYKFISNIILVLITKFNFKK